MSSLNHAFSPPELRLLNRALSDLLEDAQLHDDMQHVSTHATPLTKEHNNSVLKSTKSAVLPDIETRIEELINKRANLVESLLNTLDEQDKRCFAAFEIKSNDTILAMLTNRKRAVKQQLGTVSKSSKAIKKYHQV